MRNASFMCVCVVCDKEISLVYLQISAYMWNVFQFIHLKRFFATIPSSIPSGLSSSRYFNVWTEKLFLERERPKSIAFICVDPNTIQIWSFDIDPKVNVANAWCSCDHTQRRSLIRISFHFYGSHPHIHTQLLWLAGIMAEIKLHLMDLTRTLSSCYHRHRLVGDKTLLIRRNQIRLRVNANCFYYFERKGKGRMCVSPHLKMVVNTHVSMAFLFALIFIRRCYTLWNCRSLRAATYLTCWCSLGVGEWWWWWWAIAMSVLTCERWTCFCWPTQSTWIYFDFIV